jgi:thermitase
VRHRSFGQSLLVVLVVLALGLAPPAFAEQPVEGQTPSVEVPPEGFVPGEILVKFKSGASETQKNEAHRRKGGQRTEVIPRIDVEEVQVSQGQEESRAADYENDPNVEYAELNGVYEALETSEKRTTGSRTGSDPTASMTPSDSKIDKQWAYHNTGAHDWKKDADIDAFAAWDHTTGSSAVPIAILDTGVAQSHEDLGGKVAESVDCTTRLPCDPNASAEDKAGHGTHVAGTAAADTNNATGVAGSCPDCALYNVKVLGDNGTGSSSSVAEGIRWSADNGAKVINMSLGASARSSTIEDAVDYAWGKGVVLAAAAGNGGAKGRTYPAAYDEVIAVGASDYHDKKAGFSNYGSWVDVAAPGVGILSTTKDGKYGRMSGTSMATPHVAGVAGLVWSTSSGTGNQGVRDKIESATDRIKGTGAYWSKGRINACKAVGASCGYGR